MRFINTAVPILHTLNKIFKDGLKVAKALAHICAVGIVATATLIGQLTGLVNEDEEAVEPP